MIPIKTVNDLINKHALLEKSCPLGKLIKILLLKNLKNTQISMKLLKLPSFIFLLKKIKKIQTILEDKNSDPDMIKMAETELNDLEIQNQKNEKKLKLFLLPKDEADKKNAIIEIRAGTGGLEASLFASDLVQDV